MYCKQEGGYALPPKTAWKMYREANFWVRW